MNGLLPATAGEFSALSMMIADFALKGTALLTAAAAVTAILRRDSAAMRHRVWLLALVATLVMPVLAALLPQWRVLPNWAGGTPSAAAVKTPPHSVAGLADIATEVPLNSEAADIERPAASGQQPSVETPDSRSPLPAAELTAASAVRTTAWNHALPLVWAIGFSLLLRLAAARWVLWNLQRRATRLGPSGRPARTTDDRVAAAFEAACSRYAIRRPVTLLIHPERTIPIAWGIFRYRLLLPAAARQWSDEQLRSVLLHELAHIHRSDTTAQILAQIVCAMHWFNPLAWFAARCLCAESERACDDLVLASGVRPSAYAGHLLDVVANLSPGRGIRVCALAMARKSSLERRLLAVLSEKVDRRGISAALATTALAVTVGIAVPLAMLRAEEEKPDDEAKTAAADTSRVVAAGKPLPKGKEGRALFKQWQDNARADGNIPGALIGRLGEKVKYFISLNKNDSASGRELSEKFERMLPRFDSRRDWTPADAVTLIDAVSEIQSGPLTTALWAAEENMIRTGEPLPAALADAPWGRPSPDGLRVAWLLGPRAKEYPLGTPLRSRILVHNSGDKSAVFIMPSWQQSYRHTAHDANGEAVAISFTDCLTLARKMTYRLAPGEYCTTPAAGIGVGAMNEGENGAIVQIGSRIDATPGEEVRLSPGAVEVRCLPFVIGTEMMDGRPLNVVPKKAEDIWKRIIAERVGRELPLPGAAAQRKRIIRRVTLDLFGDEPTPEEIAAFVADDTPLAAANFEKRLAERPGVAPFTGALPPGDIQFRVLPPDPDAAKRPRVATGPGSYILDDHAWLKIERTTGRNGGTNKATILFRADQTAKPFPIALPDGLGTYAVAWRRGSGVLWVKQQGIVRRYDFSNPAQVKEATFKEPTSLEEIPKPILDILPSVSAAPGAPPFAVRQ